MTSALPTGAVRALLLENVHSDAVEVLEAAGISVETAPGALDPAELAERLANVELLGIRSKTEVTAAALDAAPRLLAIGAFCIGTNQIDLAAASERGVAVFNAPFSNTRSVVELAIAEIIALTRRLTDKSADLHAGVWDKSASGAHEVRGRTLGIVGYGNIGTQLSVLAETLGMKVMFYDTADKLALGNARRCETLDELLVDGRRRDAARRRPAGQRRHVRRGAVRADAAGQRSSSTSRGASSSTTARCVRTSSPATSPAPRSTSSRSSRRPEATSSSPSCAGCPTSSSRRTSAGPPRRRSRTSAGSSPASCATTSSTAARR